MVLTIWLNVRISGTKCEETVRKPAGCLWSVNVIHPCKWRSHSLFAWRPRRRTEAATDRSPSLRCNTSDEPRPPATEREEERETVSQCIRFSCLWLQQKYFHHPAYLWSLGKTYCTCMLMLKEKRELILHSDFPPASNDLWCLWGNGTPTSALCLKGDILCLFPSS